MICVACLVSITETPTGIRMNFIGNGEAIYTVVDREDLDQMAPELGVRHWRHQGLAALLGRCFEIEAIGSDDELNLWRYRAAPQPDIGPRRQHRRQVAQASVLDWPGPGQPNHG